jgi:hypothetical protein
MKLQQIPTLVQQGSYHFLGLFSSLQKKYWKPNNEDKIIYKTIRDKIYKPLPSLNTIFITEYRAQLLQLLSIFLNLSV